MTRDLVRHEGLFVRRLGRRGGRRRDQVRRSSSKRKENILVLLPDGAPEVPVEDLQRRLDARERLPRRARPLGTVARPAARASSSASSSPRSKRRHGARRHRAAEASTASPSCRWSTSGPAARHRRRGRPARATWCSGEGTLDDADRRRWSRATTRRSRRDTKIELLRRPSSTTRKLAVVRGARRDRRRRHQDRSHRVPGRAALRPKPDQPSPSEPVRHPRDPRRPEARPRHRRGDDAGLPDLDLRAGRAGRAQGLRVLAHPQPDALRARGQPRGARGRRVRAGFASGCRRHRPPCCTCSTRAITSSPGDDLYGGTFRLFDKVFRRLGIEFTYVDPRDVRQRSPPRSSRRTKLVWVETPDQPDAQAVRHRGGRRGRAQRRERPARASTTPS